MEMQRKIMAGRDRLSDLPDSILIHILSIIGLRDSKAVVRTSVLSTRWRFIWKSVPLSLYYDSSPSGHTENDISHFIASTNRDLYYWRSCQKIIRFRVVLSRYDTCYVKDVDLWVHFATKVANVECFTLGFSRESNPRYELPQFAYKNTSLKSLILFKCELNPSGRVDWSRLDFLSIASLNLTDGVLEKVLSGCPNLEHLELENVSGISRVEVSSVKLKYLSIKDYQNENDGVRLKILAPHLKYFELLGFCDEICLQRRNVASLVSVGIFLEFDDEDRDFEKEFSYFKELLQGVGHVEDLELGPWCIQCLSVLELEGWQSPPSSRKFLKLNAGVDSLDFPGIYRFLQSSLDLETLEIDWYNYRSRNLLTRYTDEDEHSGRFETHNFNCSLRHLKTIKFINFHGALSDDKSILPLVKYLLKSTTVLEKFVIAAILEESDVSWDYVKMEQEFLSLPRSSQHASFAFSY